MGTKLFSDLITFTRASSATRANSSGLMEAVVSNQPRFDYDPVTLQPKGLLIEEQRTNLLLNSLLDGSTLSTQTVAVTAQAYTLSFYGAGTVTLSGVYTAVVSGNGAYPMRTTLTFTPLAGALVCTVSGTVQFAQLEAGAFPTSYIPTTTAAATRAADVATITGSNFSSWYNASEGTLVADVNTAISAGYFWTLMRSGTGYGPRIQNTLNGANVSYGAVVDDVGSVPVSFTRTGLKSAFAFKTDDYALSANGGAVITDTSGVMPTQIAQLRFGSSPVGDVFINGHIRRITYYPRRLTDAELQALTA